MTSWTRLAIGLAAALVAGWISHGPLGRGEAFVAGLEGQAARVVAAAEVPGVRVRFQRSPLARTAILSGTADEFQREGQGRYPGLNDRVRAVPGVGGLRWEAGNGQ